MTYHFPEDFLRGGASSGSQSEGGSREGHRVVSEQDYWFDREPEHLFGQVGLSVTFNFYHRYPEYIEKMKQAGVRSYRASAQWSRIICGRDGRMNEEGICFYDQVIDTLIENEIEPVTYFHHFDLPLHWMEKDSFENRETAYAFAAFAAVRFERFEDRVKRWTIFNEPVTIPETGYLYQRHCPTVCDAVKAAQVGYHVQLASSLAATELRKSRCNEEIGITTGLIPTYCQGPDREEDRRAADTPDLIFNRFFLNPSVKGTCPQESTTLLEAKEILPKTREGDMDTTRENMVGYLGVNYYHPRRAKTRTTVYEGPPMSKKYYESYEPEGQKMSRSRGWEVYESTIYDIAMNIKENYKNILWYISENGMRIQDEEQYIGESGMAEDDYRVESIKEHLKYFHRAISGGCNYFGYHLWAPFDCWSWINAYKNRHGPLRVNIHDGYRITMKRPGHWFKGLSDHNGFQGGVHGSNAGQQWIADQQ